MAEETKKETALTKSKAKKEKEVVIQYRGGTCNYHIRRYKAVDLPAGGRPGSSCVSAHLPVFELKPVCL